jgi:hypothetical protein
VKRDQTALFTPITIIKLWVATDVTTNPKLQQEIKDSFLQHGVNSVAMSESNMGAHTKKGWTSRMARNARSAPFGRGDREAERGIENCASSLCSFDHQVTVPCQISTTAQMLHNRHNNSP